MSITFHCRAADGIRITLDIGDVAYFNLAGVNGRAFLLFLRIDAGEDLTGEISMPEARRAVIRARATFDREVGHFVRQTRDTKPPGRARSFEAGVGVEYFAGRLDAFEKFIEVMAERGAVSICWS